MLREESGQALIAGIVVLMVIMGLGMAALQTADVQSHQTGFERNTESAFNVAESALDAETSLLQTTWPTSSSGAYPVCTQASTASSTCPAGSVSAGFNTTYAGSGFASPTWSVQVIDDDVSGVADAGYYSDAILNSTSLAHWDSNADNRLWVRASATIRGRTRTLIVQVQRETVPVWLPQNVLTAGGVTTSNNGNKIIIEAKDSTSGLTGSVDVRCGDANTAPTYGSTCAGWDPKHGQLDPAGSYQTGYVDPLASYQSLTNATLDSLRTTAQANNTYYQTGCPPLGKAGILFVENANCSYSGQGNGTYQWNSDSAPGAIIVASGTLTLNAINFYGIIYMADGQGTVPPAGCKDYQQTPAIFTVQGTGTLHGGLFIDKCGTAAVGDSGFDIIYDTKAFGGLRTDAEPSMALSTFRVLSNNGS